MADAMWKPIIPKDWVGLERVINELWRLINTDTSLSSISLSITDAESAIAALQVATNAMNLAIVDLQEAVAAIDPVAGNDTQVQFNDGGSMGASSDFTFNKVTKVADVNGTIKVKRLLAGGVH
jgi:hypothetical protein